MAEILHHLRIPLLIPTNSFQWFQSGAKWSSSIHSMFIFPGGRSYTWRVALGEALAKVKADDMLAAQVSDSTIKEIYRTQPLPATSSKPPLVSANARFF